MSRTNKNEPELIVVELGADWPTALTAAGGCRVIAEVEGEGPLGFATRVDEFVASAFPRAVSVARAVVACNLRADQTAEAARRATAESLLSRLGQTGSLWFTASQSAGDRFRRRLLDLVAELGGTPGAAGRVQALLGEDESRASGPRSSDLNPARPRKVAHVA